ncbi:hypothetical protein ACT29H_03760 [Thermophagus sp. OGC60D27]|uniref:hypothetical protein n=1 Tax=Thermophagus sp. OGC60D27 TaxID=3458415 RepID=UPI0040376B05
MKKLIFTLAMIVGFTLSTKNLSAQNNGINSSQEQTSQTVRTGFIDNNGDGICDNYDGNRSGQGLGPGHGYGQGRINGKGLVRKNHQGHGRKGHIGLRNGSGKINNRQGIRYGNFVDSNNNGLCDRIENGTGPQVLQDGSGKGNGQNNN